MALLELKNLHVALEDGTEIVKGVDLSIDTERGARDHGAERLGQVHPRLHADGSPRLRGDRGGHPLRRRVDPRGRPGRAGAEGPLPRLPVPAGHPGRVRHELPAHRHQRRAARAQRRRRRPDADPGVPQGALRADGEPQGLARARVALPERRLLGRREEARRDPADGAPQAADRRPRRDRLRPRHRRAEDRRERRPAARRPGDGRARHHALPADPQLHHAGSRPRLRRRQDRRRAAARSSRTSSRRKGTRRSSPLLWEARA